MTGPPGLTMSPPDHEGERIQKVLSHAGVGSRRHVEAWIQQGRIRVNGEVVSELGRRINPEHDVVEKDGQPLHLRVDQRYVVYHKPTKVVTSLRDEKGRADLQGVLATIGERLHPVGRLDYDTSGLLLLTNDGDATQVLAHPSFGVLKTYRAVVQGVVSAPTLQRLKRGVELEDGQMAVDRVSVVETGETDRTVLELTIHSGRNRIVRRLLDAVGHPVLTLHRTSFGPFHLGGLKPGHFRDLEPRERHELASLVEDAKKTAQTAKGTL